METRQNLPITKKLNLNINSAAALGKIFRISKCVFIEASKIFIFYFSLQKAEKNIDACTESTDII
jgi:hypothetical protein